MTSSVTVCASFLPNFVKIGYHVPCFLLPTLYTCCTLCSAAGCLCWPVLHALRELPVTVGCWSGSVTELWSLVLRFWSIRSKKNVHLRHGTVYFKIVIQHCHNAAFQMMCRRKRKHPDEEENLYSSIKRIRSSDTSSDSDFVDHGDSSRSLW